jgi:2-methylcitrate dehydratase PrpD
LSKDHTDNPATRGVAEFVANLQYEQIPEDVRHRAKRLILDALGCGLFGANLEWSRILQDRLATLDATRSCAIWGTGKKLSAPHATLVNGTQVQGFELDDTHLLGILHCGSVILPPLISIVEERPGMSGREFLTAAIAGYEVGPRVGICMGNEHLAQGWHSGATAGVFAAAASAARGLRLDVDKTVHALGIAGTQASGLMAAQFGSMVKRMHSGRAAQSGLYGAQFADAGFTGIVNVFESEYGGFCTTFSRSTDRFKIGELTAGYGEVWQAMGVRLKFYSCVGSNHTALDLIRDFRAERPFTADEVAKVVVYGPQATVEHSGWKYVPQGFTAAQMNLSFCVATELIEGDCFVDQFTEEKLTDPLRMALAEKIEVIHDPAITARGPKFRQMLRLEVHLKDGTKMERTREIGRHKVEFGSDAEVVGKFEKLALRVLPKAQVEELCDCVLNLEKLDDAGKLAQLLAGR